MKCAASAAFSLIKLAVTCTLINGKFSSLWWRSVTPSFPFTALSSNINITPIPQRKESFNAAIDLEKLGPRTIWVDCDVLQADGGTRTAAITGSYVALSLAARKLVTAGKLAESPLSHPVAAVSVGIVEGRALLDLCYTEDAAAAVDLNLVMNAAGQFIELQGSGEESTFSEPELAELLALGKAGIRELLAAQQAALA